VGRSAPRRGSGSGSGAAKRRRTSASPRIVAPTRFRRRRRPGPASCRSIVGSATQVRRLRTVSPPASPVVWASFETSRSPERHGVFGSVVRDPLTYLPRPGDLELRADEEGTPGMASYRSGTAFWEVAASAGVPTKVLFAPYASVPVGGWRVAVGALPAAARGHVHGLRRSRRKSARRAARWCGSVEGGTPRERSRPGRRASRLVRSAVFRSRRDPRRPEGTVSTPVSATSRRTRSPSPSARRRFGADAILPYRRRRAHAGTRRPSSSILPPHSGLDAVRLGQAARHLRRGEASGGSETGAGLTGPFADVFENRSSLNKIRRQALLGELDQDDGTRLFVAFVTTPTARGTR
jgi:hypothetical protein